MHITFILWTQPQLCKKHCGLRNPCFFIFKCKASRNRQSCGSLGELYDYLYIFHISVSDSLLSLAHLEPLSCALRIFMQLWIFLELTIRLISTCHWFTISSRNPFLGPSKATWRCKKAFYWTGPPAAQTLLPRLQNLLLWADNKRYRNTHNAMMKILDGSTRLSWKMGIFQN